MVYQDKMEETEHQEHLVEMEHLEEMVRMEIQEQMELEDQQDLKVKVHTLPDKDYNLMLMMTLYLKLKTKFLNSLIHN